ncbi:MAG: cell division protein ZapB [Caldisericaceae bacterium]|nr:cell division protein ZapB [Caldisericaceae bacterium]
MNLQHFDKLKQNVKELIEQHRELRFKNYQLEQEIAELKDRLKVAENSTEEINLKEIEKLKEENQNLRAERDALKERLKRLIAQLEQIDIM